MNKQIFCPKCQSTEVTFRSKKQCYICDNCNHEFVSEVQFESLRIFLSYGHDHNEELVRLIKTDLEKRGHDVWFDKNEIKFGDEWRRSITDGILGSNRVLSFLSKHSTRDPGVCRDEIAIAIGVKGGNIQTILVESEKEVQPPVNIGHIQWLDMHDWQEKKANNEAEWEQWYQGKLAEIISVVESEETRRFAGEIEKLNEYLKPIKSDARISGLLNKGFYGREWLFEAVENWRMGFLPTKAVETLQSEIRNPKSEIASPSHLFWIMGDPGVGKSAFVAQLTHTHGDTVIAAQFVEWDKPDHRDAQRVVCSIAFQIATRLPDYRKLLLTFPEIKELDRKDASELFDYLLANPLRAVINGGREKFLIVIDALDEAGESGRNPLVDMLARNAHHLPEWLGIVVTSRPEFDVKTPFQALNPLPLDTKSESNKTDIRDYLNNKLATQLQNQSNAETLLNQILEKSEGVFLYAERFCEDVNQGHISLNQPDQFPQGLGGIFFQYFQRQFPDLKVYEKIIEPMLGTILAARKPLPVEILQKLFNWKETELRKWLRALGSLFPVITEGGSKVIKPYHKSLSDWLADEKKAGEYFVGVIDGHRMLSCFYSSNWKIDNHSLSELPYHLILSNDFYKVSQLLFNPRFQNQKIEKLGRQALLNDYLNAENNSFGFFGISGVGCFLLNYAWLEEESVEMYKMRDSCNPLMLPVLKSYLSIYQQLFEDSCKVSNNWISSIEYKRYCIEFCINSLEIYNDRCISIITETINYLNRLANNETVEKIEHIKNRIDLYLFDVIKNIGTLSNYSLVNAKKRNYLYEYEKNMYNAVYAALNLQPLKMVIALWEAQREKSMTISEKKVDNSSINLSLYEANIKLMDNFTVLMKKIINNCGIC